MKPLIRLHIKGYEENFELKSNQLQYLLQTLLLSSFYHTDLQQLQFKKLGAEYVIPRQLIYKRHKLKGTLHQMSVYSSLMMMNACCREKD